MQRGAQLMPLHTVVLTGANSGLGRHTLRVLLDRTPAEMIVPVRNRLAEAAVREVLRPEDQNRVFLVSADLSDFGAVRDLGSSIAARVHAGEFRPVTAVVLNAAVLRLHARAVNTDQIELMMATNALSPHLMLAALSTALDPTARIVAVGSAVIRRRWWHRPATDQIDWRSALEQRCRPHDDGRAAYAASKLALYQLCRTLGTIAPPGMAVSYFDPGMMPGTGIARDSKPLARAYWQHVLPRLMRTTTDASVGRSAQALADTLAEPTVFRGAYVGVRPTAHPEIVGGEIDSARAYFRAANDLLGISPPECADWWR